MAAQPGPVGPQQVDAAVADTCPRWCALHGDGPEFHAHGEGVHVSGPLVVKRTVLRLAASVDPDTGATDGPLVYVGEEEYTLHQAEVLIDALTHLVDEGAGETQSQAGAGPLRCDVVRPPRRSDQAARGRSGAPERPGDVVGPGQRDANQGWCRS